MRIEKLASLIDNSKLLKEVENLKNWTLDGTGIFMWHMQGQGLPEELIKNPNLTNAIGEICKLTGFNPLNMMLNKIPPGVSSGKHQDFLPNHPIQGKYPCLARWHLPIKTNDYSVFWTEQHGGLKMETNYWYGPIAYWKFHNVGNYGSEERIHLIVDLDSSIRIGNYN